MKATTTPIMKKKEKKMLRPKNYPEHKETPTQAQVKISVSLQAASKNQEICNTLKTESQNQRV